MDIEIVLSDTHCPCIRLFAPRMRTVESISSRMHAAVMCLNSRFPYIGFLAVGVWAWETVSNVLVAVVNIDCGLLVIRLPAFWVRTMES